MNCIALALEAQISYERYRLFENPGDRRRAFALARKAGSMSAQVRDFRLPENLRGDHEPELRHQWLRGYTRSIEIKTPLFDVGQMPGGAVKVSSRRLFGAEGYVLIPRNAESDIYCGVRRAERLYDHEDAGNWFLAYQPTELLRISNRDDARFEQLLLSPGRPSSGWIYFGDPRYEDFQIASFFQTRGLVSQLLSGVPVAELMPEECEGEGFLLSDGFCDQCRLNEGQPCAGSDDRDSVSSFGPRNDAVTTMGETPWL